MILKPMRIWCYPVVLFCACVALLYTDRAFCATKSQAMQGNWIIALERTKKEDLRVYFGGNDEQYLLEKASSAVFTFDIKNMQFICSVLGKEKIRRRIKEITKSQNYSDSISPEKFTLWLAQVKFPDYIVVLPDGRLRYGSTWGHPWEFILQRK